MRATGAVDIASETATPGADAAQVSTETLSEEGETLPVFIVLEASHRCVSGSLYYSSERGELDRHVMLDR